MLAKYAEDLRLFDVITPNNTRRRKPMATHIASITPNNTRRRKPMATHIACRVSM